MTFPKIFAAAFTSLVVAGAAHAADLPTFQLEMADGKLNPARIEVPAGQRIKIEVRNTGKGAVEFESVQLRKEKVLAPGADSFVVIAPLSPGEYKFFDSPGLGGNTSSEGGSSGSSCSLPGTRR